MLELNDLVIFRHVARLGSMSAAAITLGYVQSNITARIRALEQGLHTELFVRTPRGVTLLPAGERLLLYADQIVGLMEQAQSELMSFSTKPSSAPLRVGATLTITAGYLTEAVWNGQLALEVFTRPSRELITMLLADELDGILLNRPWHDDSGQTSCRFTIQETIGWAMPASLAPDRSRSSDEDSLPAKLALYPLLVMRDSDCPYHQATLEYMHRYPQYAWNVRHVDTLDMLITLIRDHKGTAILPQRIVRQSQQMAQMNWQPLILAGKQPVRISIAYYERQDKHIQEHHARMVKQLLLDASASICNEK